MLVYDGEKKKPASIPASLGGITQATIREFLANDANVYVTSQDLVRGKCKCLCN